ncbi:MAG: thiamine phosphate synthase [Marinovum sp.]|nr:thiamine phosphate synthase [Marinovum sp.]
MSAPEHPQIYLITPPHFEIARFSTDLAAALDAVEVAAVRLSLTSHDQDTVTRAADACRNVTEARDVALVIDTHVALAEMLGLDGVHLNQPQTRAVREARKRLGPDAVVGVHAGQSRHEGLSAGESGADYVCFGPIGVSALGDGAQAGPELFAWWSEMIELPIVAEGAVDLANIALLRDKTDFFALGSEVWASESPVNTLTTLAAAIQDR